MEDTVQRNKRALREQRENGGHSKHRAQSDAGKEEGNGGHFLEKQRGKANSAKLRKKHKGKEDKRKRRLGEQMGE